MKENIHHKAVKYSKGGLVRSGVVHQTSGKAMKNCAIPYTIEGMVHQAQGKDY